MEAYYFMKYDIKLGSPNLLTVLFIGLKLTNNITWSWWWVLSPTWIPLMLVVLFFIAVMLVKIFE